MDKFLTPDILDFGSSCGIIMLSFLLGSIQIRKEEGLKKLRIARRYLTLSYFILAGFGFLSYFMNIEAENNPAFKSSILFVSSYQALLFTGTLLTFIYPDYVKKILVWKQLFVITITGISLLLVAIFFKGPAVHYVLYIAIVLYLFQLLYYVRLFRRAYSKCLKHLEVYYDEDEDNRLRFVKLCFYSALGIGILSLLFLFSNKFLYSVFIIIYTVYYTLVVCMFYNYMTNLNFFIPVLSMKATNSASEGIAGESGTDLTKNLSEQEQQLKASLEKWAEEKLYCEKDIGVDDIVKMLGTTRNFLRYYFRCYMHTDFRTWRVELRIAEAKSIMKKNPGISLSKVCKMAGFNHRANFHRQFQKITGETPAEYKNTLMSNSLVTTDN